MALIKCEECGQMVSSKAEMCPNCGCPVEGENKQMGLIKCEECGLSVSVMEKICPKCGCLINKREYQELNCTEHLSQKNQNKWRFLTGGVAVIAVIVCVLSIFAITSSKQDANEETISITKDDSKSNNQQDKETTNTANDATKNDKHENWIYNTKTDPMTDKVSYFARCVSQETQVVCGKRTQLHLGLSYIDGMSLVGFYINKGVFRQDRLPMAYVRFDNDPVEMMSVMTDGATAEYIVSTTKFLSRLKESKKCAIKIEAQDGGTATYTFITEGLEWDY